MSGRSLRVLHFVWNLIRGGTEGQCARVALEFARRGSSHAVWVFRREGFYLPAVERLCGPVEEIGISGLFNPRLASQINDLAGRIKNGAFDVLHAWDADAAIFGQFAAERAGITFITSRRDLGQIYPWYKQVLLRRADKRAVAIVANSRAIVDHFAKRATPRDKFRIIPNILDVNEFDALHARPFPRAVEWNTGSAVIMVARLDPEKDHATFLHAAARVLAHRPDAHFVVAGEGVERRKLENFAKKLGISTRTHFLGDVSEVPALLRFAAIGALTPSRNEGLSNTILEYMAARLPVVATDCGGNRELVDPPRGGFLVPIKDDAGLADAIIRLLDNPALRVKMGEHNRARVVRDHQPAAIADQFEDLYRSALRELACRN